MSDRSTPRHDDDPLALRLPGRRSVPAERVQWRATTSGGPGGQHANRTASRVEVVVQLDSLPLEPREIARLYERLASRITGAGEIVVGCADSRDQHRNRRTALRRMERLLRDALAEPRRRVPTRPSAGARLRRRESKQQTSQRKRSRRWNWRDGDTD